MIKKTCVFCDIDGCLTERKNFPFNDKLYVKLITSIKLYKHFSLCTGRSIAYVEALTQMLNIKDWCICENGCYWYHPIKDQIIYNNLIKEDTLIALQEAKQIILSKKLSNLCKLELGKELCLSLNSLNNELSISELYQEIKNHCASSLLYISHSSTAVDITPLGINKGSALQQLIEQENINLNDCLGIGDSDGDLSFMTLVQHRACPANASTEILKLCNYNSPFNYTTGIIDILERYKDE